MVLEYDLTGGKLRIGKKEMAFELLRKDSVLRPLLGYGAGGLASMASRKMATQDDGDFTVLDFTRMTRRVGDNPEAMLRELKRRYGSAVGGKLFFRCTYTTFGHVFYLEADLDAQEVDLHSASD
jgi:hypothetical protein